MEHPHKIRVVVTTQNGMNRPLPVFKCFFTFEIELKHTCDVILLL